MSTNHAKKIADATPKHDGKIDWPHGEYSQEFAQKTGVGYMRELDDPLSDELELARFRSNKNEGAA